RLLELLHHDVARLLRGELRDREELLLLLGDLALELLVVRLRLGELDAELLLLLLERLLEDGDLLALLVRLGFTPRKPARGVEHLLLALALLLVPRRLGLVAQVADVGFGAIAKGAGVLLRLLAQVHRRRLGLEADALRLEARALDVLGRSGGARGG